MRKINTTQALADLQRLSSRQLFFRAKSSTLASAREPRLLSKDVPVEEETLPDYDPKRFYPIRLGQVLPGSRKVLAKLGWGSNSTVWLAEDTSRWFWQQKKYVAVKVAQCDEDHNVASHERDITNYLHANPAHDGFGFVRAAIDHFELEGPHGTHPCLVYEPTRESLKFFQMRLPDGKIPVPLLKLFLRYILMGLDYLHSECRIIHTDLKQDNVMLTFEDPSVLEIFVKELDQDAVPRKVQDTSNLGGLGLAQRAGGREPLRHPIQPPVFHAPEVILGTEWSYSADIWNFGVLIWNLLENRNLFRDISSSKNTYDSRKHLAEMIALLGPPPKELIDREEKWSKVEYSRAFPNSEGNFVWTARECFGGPFFDSEGAFLYKNLIPSDFNLRDSIPSLEGEDKERFLDFASCMLQWLPEKRKTAKELLGHPWLVTE